MSFQLTDDQHAYLERACNCRIRCAARTTAMIKQNFNSFQPVIDEAEARAREWGISIGSLNLGSILYLLETRPNREPVRKLIEDAFTRCGGSE